MDINVWQFSCSIVGSLRSIQFSDTSEDVGLSACPVAADTYVRPSVYLAVSEPYRPIFKASGCRLIRKDDEKRGVA
jgi:hypothetical protein